MLQDIRDLAVDLFLADQPSLRMTFQFNNT